MLIHWHIVCSVTYGVKCSHKGDNIKFISSIKTCVTQSSNVLSQEDEVEFAKRLCDIFYQIKKDEPPSKRNEPQSLKRQACGK